MYDIFIEKPEPLVPRSLRYGVRERTLDDGSVLRELDEEQVRSVAAEIGQRGIGAVAVSFLHGFRNPAHERRVAEILAEEAPEVTVSLSSRGVAGDPGIRAHLDDDSQRLRPPARRAVSAEARRTAAKRSGSRARSTSCSRTAARPAWRRRADSPIRLLESGPAAGALAAAFYGRELPDFPKVLSFDMGGTTAKACLIDGGEPLTSTRVRGRPGLPVQEGVGACR